MLSFGAGASSGGTGRGPGEGWGIGAFGRGDAGCVDAEVDADVVDAGAADVTDCPAVGVIVAALPRPRYADTEMPTDGAGSASVDATGSSGDVSLEADPAPGAGVPGDSAPPVSASVAASVPAAVPAFVLAFVTSSGLCAAPGASGATTSSDFFRRENRPIRPA
jgi:hypothetical protein